ncbi:hypothetical protein [Paractinoplanes maris]|uniref:hypothetical protein n=1 Tax=Paractinoplanes maris TaxID=1734446 RepID=UPI00202128D3|nr:hypothetical protein [Actinoplanes maris]
MSFDSRLAETGELTVDLLDRPKRGRHRSPGANQNKTAYQPRRYAADTGELAKVVEPARALDFPPLVGEGPTEHIVLPASPPVLPAPLPSLLLPTRAPAAALAAEQHPSRKDRMVQGFLQALQTIRRAAQ